LRIAFEETNKVSHMPAATFGHKHVHNGGECWIIIEAVLSSRGKLYNFTCRIGIIEGSSRIVHGNKNHMTGVIPPASWPFMQQNPRRITNCMYVFLVAKPALGCSRFPKTSPSLSMLCPYFPRHDVLGTTYWPGNQCNDFKIPVPA
jgi:hypothetical protein